MCKLSNAQEAVRNSHPRAQFFCNYPTLLYPVSLPYSQKPFAYLLPPAACYPSRAAMTDRSAATLSSQIRLRCDVVHPPLSNVGLLLPHSHLQNSSIFLPPPQNSPKLTKAQQSLARASLTQNTVMCNVGLSFPTPSCKLLNLPPPITRTRQKTHQKSTIPHNNRILRPKF